MPGKYVSKEPLGEEQCDDCTRALRDLSVAVHYGGKEQGVEAVRIYSDGGGERNSAAAAACIVDLAERRMQVVAYLGAATNNEAEIFGGLLAFSTLHAAPQKRKAKEVEWFCDSEYVLKSATEYIHNWQRNGWKTAAKKAVKNQSLFRMYLELSQGLKVKPQHVYGHTGHPENEACDSASTWARTSAHAVLDDQPQVVDSLSGYASGVWVLLDGRDILAQCRESEGEPPSTELVWSLKEKLAAVLQNPDLASLKPRKESPQAAMLRKLSALAVEIRSLEGQWSDAAEMRRRLEDLIEEFAE